MSREAYHRIAERPQNTDVISQQTPSSILAPVISAVTPGPRESHYDINRAFNHVVGQHKEQAEDTSLEEIIPTASSTQVQSSVQTKLSANIFSNSPKVNPGRNESRPILGTLSANVTIERGARMRKRRSFLTNLPVHAKSTESTNSDTDRIDHQLRTHSSMTMVGVEQRPQTLPPGTQPPLALNLTRPLLFMRSMNITKKVNASQYLTFGDAKENYFPPDACFVKKPRMALSTVTPLRAPCQPRLRLLMTMVGVSQEPQTVPSYAQPPLRRNLTRPSIFMRSVNVMKKVDASQYLIFTDAEKDYSPAPTLSSMSRKRLCSL